MYCLNLFTSIGIKRNSQILFETVGGFFKIGLQRICREAIHRIDKALRVLVEAKTSWVEIDFIANLF